MKLFVCCSSEHIIKKWVPTYPNEQGVSNKFRSKQETCDGHQKQRSQALFFYREEKDSHPALDKTPFSKRNPNKTYPPVSDRTTLKRVGKERGSLMSHPSYKTKIPQRMLKAKL